MSQFFRLLAGLSVSLIIMPRLSMIWYVTFLPLPSFKPSLHEFWMHEFLCYEVWAICWQCVMRLELFIFIELYKLCLEGSSRSKINQRWSWVFTMSSSRWIGGHDIKKCWFARGQELIFLEVRRVLLHPCFITQITLRRELLSQIKGSVAVFRDQIHRELENLINLIWFVKLSCLMI